MTKEPVAFLTLAKDLHRFRIDFDIANRIPRFEVKSLRGLDSDNACIPPKRTPSRGVSLPPLQTSRDPQQEDLGLLRRCLCQLFLVPSINSNTSKPLRKKTTFPMQQLVIQYRWHPLYGQKVPLIRRMGRRGNQVVHVEVRRELSP